MLFSERIGITPIRTAIQKESMDDDLKNGLWDILDISIFSSIKKTHSINEVRRFEDFLKNLWHLYYKLPIDTIPIYTKIAIDFIRNYYFSAMWYQVYDFIEFIVENNKDVFGMTDVLITGINKILERELSAYRFVNGKLCAITSEEEIASIETAAQYTDKFAAASTHINTAIQHFSNRTNPDYRNSIKESISAVEAVCKIIGENGNGTLGNVLNELDRKYPGRIHPAFKEALSKLYGYTCGKDGIRHSLIEETANPDSVDAKFMLVSCSAFVNYLIAKFE